MLVYLYVSCVAPPVAGRALVLFRRCLIQSILIDSREPVTPKCDGAAMMLMLMVPRGCSGGGAGRLEQPATA